MTYLATREQYGRIESYIDIVRFAHDLAVKLDGTVEDRTKLDRFDDDYQIIQLSPTLNLSVNSNRYGCKGKVHVAAVAAGIPTEDRPYQDSRGTYKMPEAWVSAERPLAVIARDLKRRVIDAAAAPLANTLAYVVQRKEQRGDLATTIARLQAAVPEMQESKNGASSDGYNKTLYWMGGGTYLTARAYATGDVGIDRIGNVPLDAFIEIAAILRKYNKKEAV